MTDAQTLRHQLRAAGYCPIPLYGKEPPQYGKNNARKGMKGWQTFQDITPEMVDMYSKTWPDAVNTGCLTFNMPVVDIDILNEEAARALEDHVREHFEERGYLLTRIGRPPKRAIPFRTAMGPFKTFKISLTAPDGSEGQKIELLADGAQVVVDGIHPDTGQPYRWFGGELGKIPREELPDIREDEAHALVDELIEILVRDFGYRRAPGRPQNKGNGGDGGGGKAGWAYLLGNIHEGRELHDSLRDLAAMMIAAGTNSGAVINQLNALMDETKAPKDERWLARKGDIPKLVDSAVAKYGKEPSARLSSEPAAEPEPKVEPKPEPKPKLKSGYTIDDVIAVFKSWLVLSSTTPVYAMLGTVAANLLEGDPVWLGLIAPPSSAKSELLNSIAGLPNVVDADTVTPSGLLSGTPKKQQDKGARGGLLRQIGSFGIITLKDFGSVLSMHAETRAETLAALRKIYDGAWTRHLGSAGGKSLSWQGKVAIIFAATEVIDAHHSVISSMGDRFLLSRLKPVTGKKQFARALKHTGGGFNQMRKELAAAVAKLFANRRTEASQINEQETEAIGKAIALAVRLRGAVARDYRSRELEAIYGAEGTARIGLALERLLAGLETLGMDRKMALTIVEEVALDSVPPLRRVAYECVRKYSERLTPVETADVAIELGLPTTSARRILEDLAAHGLIVRRSQGKGKADIWDKLPWEADEARADAKED
jgi:hypothetical protein